MKTLLAVSLSVLIVCAVAGASDARQLYAVGLDERSLADATELGDVVIRHVGSSEMLVEGPADAVEGLSRGGHVVSYLGEARGTAELFVCYPGRSRAAIESMCDVLWSEPSGALVVSCDAGLAAELRALSFMSYPLPLSVDASSWFDNEAPGHIAGRSAADELPVRGVVSDVINSISADSLMAHVERLSVYPGGEPRSRFVYREECLTEAKRYIVDRFAECLPAGATVDTQRFFVDGYSCDEGSSGPIVQYPADNVVGVLPGTGRLSGYYVICAHYDATASNSFPGSYEDPPFYWWCENPAPGADDNATGVATLIEVARALSGLSFPFDIRFVAFSAEEIGLVGSGVYADSVAGYRAASGSYVAPPDTIYGVLNVDMIAYKRQPGNVDSCHIVTNPGTVWFADWIVDTAEVLYEDLFPDFEALRIDEALAYSDHAPFWQNDYDALAALEHAHPRERNPYYHTTGDIDSTVYSSQLTSIARMVAGSMARLVDTDGTINLAVFPDDVSFYTTGGIGEYLTDHLVIGEPARVRVDFHAFGPEETADVTLEVWDGPTDTGTLLSTVTMSRAFGGGEAVSHSFDWDLTDDDLGEHFINARVTGSGLYELNLSDNVTGGVAVRVDAPRLFVSDHFTWPNPAGDPEELNIAYRLSRESEGSVDLKVFDLTGQEMASTTLYYNVSGDNEGLNPGLNSIGWPLLEGSASDLASGVYVYQITVYDRDGIEPVDQVMGKFAVVR